MTANYPGSQYVVTALGTWLRLVEMRGASVGHRSKWYFVRTPVGTHLRDNDPELQS